MSHSFIHDLVAQRQRSLQELLDQRGPVSQYLDRSELTPCDRRFSRALRSGTGLAVIAEIKRKSPSVGHISAIEDPVSLAELYTQGGAAAISVLTEPTRFGGSIRDLEQVSGSTSLPTLRKDFLTHPIQIAEAKLAGASAVLLIVALFRDTPTLLESLIQDTERMGLEALVEVHDEAELEVALEKGATLIGVNQRNLHTLSMHPELFASLANRIPSHVVRVAESGIRTVQDARRVQDLGYHAILVGEALVRAENPGVLIEQLRGGPQHVSYKF